MEVKKYSNFNINLRGYDINIGSRTYIMGILNVTPDSFSDGGKFTSVDIAVKHALEMEKLGADIIDVGGESTRPGAKKVNVEEELSRVIPVVERLVKEVNLPISVDTYKSEVARKTLEIGVHMINDVWGLQKDEKIADVIAEYDVPICIMHNKENTDYDIDIMKSIKMFFKKSLDIAHKAGIKDDKILLDPGIGFGKTYEQNLEVMDRLEELNDLGYPILLGISRKSIIGNTLNVPANERLEGTIATNIIGIVKGTEIIRVHDIKENLKAVKVADAILRGGKWTKY